MVIRAVYDTSECSKAFQEWAGLPVINPDKPVEPCKGITLRGDTQTDQHHDPHEDTYASLQLVLQNDKVRLMSSVTKLKQVVAVPM